MFSKIVRSWEFAKISYGILWDFKSLLLFPIFSTVAAVLVLASFLAPLWYTGTLEYWSISDQQTPEEKVIFYAITFVFYFCNYFVIIFFNAGLVACAMKVMRGETPTVGYGLWMASKRLPQIIGWALVSAVVGLILKAIENTNKKLGRFIAAIMGSAWTALTFFVIPAIVIEGVGPYTAVKRSIQTLHKTWGEHLIGGFSMGVLTLLVMIPITIVLLAILYLAVAAGSLLAIAGAVALMIVVFVIAAAASSAADVVFRTILFNYASGRMLPESIDASSFDEAFVGKEWQPD